jgi:mRNA interferase MazF
MADLYKQGDIVDINLGLPPNEVKGHEQANIRPCLVFKSLERLGLLIVLPITGTETKYAQFTIVELKPGSNGLTKISFVLCHQIRTVSVKRISKKRGAISVRDLNKIIAVLKDTLDI